MTVRLLRTETSRAVLGVLFNPSAVWFGAHWSGFNRRLCVNVVPCLTLWVVLPGGTEP